MSDLIDVICALSLRFEIPTGMDRNQVGGSAHHPELFDIKMASPIPTFVDSVLQEWDFIAFFAYDGFESSGRGAVGLMESDDGVQAMYGDADYFHQIGDERVIKMIEDYDPEKEFLVHFDAAHGTRTIRIKTPEGGSHPKRVWFFEMIRRVSEEPEALPNKLPDWFVSACETLAALKNNEDEQAHGK